MRKYQAVAFDLEGTIVDVERFHKEAFRLLVEELHVPINFDEAWTNWIGRGDEFIARDIAGRLAGEVSADWQEIRRRKMEIYSGLIAAISIEARPGFWRVYEGLAKRGMPMAIGSLTPRTQAQVILQRSGLDQAFRPERIVLLEDVPNKKPAPDVYLETAYRLGVSPYCQLVFEDSPVGVQAAWSAGSQAIAIPSVCSRLLLEQLMKAGAMRICMGWDEVDMEELLTIS